MNKEDLKEKLTEEGFVHVYEWNDNPNTQYETHAHTGEVSMYILRGGLTFQFGKKEVVLKMGDRFDVPAGEAHTAVVGPEGCVYLVGEMINGDS